jgi:hypothetical protein
MAWEQLAPQTITRLSTDLSISPQVAAGIVGQLGYESAGLQSINEMQPVVPGSRGGFGWAQWTGPRRRQFESWAEQNKMDVADPEANYQFLLHELTQTPEKGVLKKLEGVTDPKEAGRIFTNTFLRPGVPAQDKRDSWVEKSLNFILPTAQAGTLANTPNEPQYSQEELQQALQQATAANDTEAITELQEMMATQSRTMPVTQAPQYSQEELQQALQQATAANDVEAVAELEAMLGSAISPPEKAQLPQERKITDEAFNTDPTWINNAKTLFKEVEGSDFKGNDADAADWLKNYVAQTNWNLVGAGTTILDTVNKLSPSGKQALLQSIEEYEQAPTSMESVGRAVKGIATDPTTYAGLGVGSVLTKTVGRKAAMEGLKQALKQGMTKGVGAKTASALTGQGAQVAAGGAAFAGADEALRQGVQVGAGGQEELDVGGIATSAGLGGAGGLGASKLINRLTGRTDVRKFGARAGSERQAQIDAEIAQDFQQIARNPNALIAEGADEASIATAVRNEVNKKYFGDVRRALEIVDPEELKRLDVKISLDSPKVTTQEELTRLRKTPNGNILADSIEKYQRAIALTSPEAASGSLAAKTTRAGLQYGPKLAAGAIGASTLGPMGFLLGPLAQGVSAGTAQRFTGKKTVPEVIKELSSGRGLKAAQNVSELLGPSDTSINAEKLLERARRSQQSQAAKAAAQQQAQSQSTLPSVLKSTAAVRQQAGLKGRPVSGAYTEFLGRTGLSNEQAIPLLREFSKDFKGGEIGKASKSLLQSKPIKDEASFYAIQDLAADIAKKRGILAPQQGALSSVSPVVNPISYAAVINNAQAARDIAIKAAPNDQMAQFATTIAAIKSPQAKKEALDLAISQVTDAAERDFLVKYIEPLTKFGKKAK